MISAQVFLGIVDNLPEPIVFVDTHHIIRYLNQAAIERYRRKGKLNLIGQSLLDCHNEQSCQRIKEVFAEIQMGSDEKFLYINEDKKLYMTAVRDPDGNLLGYYERFEKITNESKND